MNGWIQYQFNRCTMIQDLTLEQTFFEIKSFAIDGPSSVSAACKDWWRSHFHSLKRKQPWTNRVASVGSVLGFAKFVIHFSLSLEENIG